jgi:hypothetical protein
MNLIQVQDSLNKLPPLPQSIQYLTAAAQGGNPQVPPFMALARISEINKEMQTAQQPQAPAEPLNESLPKQALQSMGIGALQQGQQQQGMQQMAQQAGAAQQAVPPGIPQPMRQQPPPQQMQMAQQAQRPMPQGAPQMQRPQGMAGGGLAGLPVDPRMFEYGSGGVVAFEEGGEVDADYDAAASMKELAPYIKAALTRQAPSISAPSDIEKKLREGKDYGIEEGPIGKGYLEGLASLKEARAAERAKQQSDIDERKKFATSRSLLDYSDASRGQTGLGGIGALARSRMGSAEKFMGEEAGLREDAIKQDSLMNEAQYKMQDLRTAKLKGDVAGEYKAQSDLAKIAKDLNVSQNQLMARLASGNLSLLGKETTTEGGIEQARIRAAAKAAGAGKPPKVTDQQRGVDDIAADLRTEHPEWPESKVRATATNLYRQSSSAPNVAAKVTKDINEAWGKQQFKPEYLEAPDKAAYEREWKAKWRQANPDAAPAAKAGTAENPIKIK